MTTALLVDTSAWVDFLRRIDSPLRPHVADNSAGHTEPVAMEILSGAKDKDSWHSLQRLLLRSPLIIFDAASDFTSAARMRRQGLQTGIKVGAVDCLILAVASRTRTPLLTMDRSQARLAESFGIESTLLTP